MSEVDIHTLYIIMVVLFIIIQVGKVLCQMEKQKRIFVEQEDYDAAKNMKVCLKKVFVDFALGKKRQTAVGSISEATFNRFIKGTFAIITYSTKQ